MDPMMVLFFRMIFAQAILMPWLFKHGLKALSTSRLKLHAVRAIFTCGAMVSSFYAWSMIPLADVTALSFLAPIFATVGAALFLGETVRGRRWAATFTGFIGAMVILRPGFIDLELGHWLALIFAGFMACTMLVVKSLSRTENPIKVVFFVGIFITPVSLALALQNWQWPPTHLWLWLFLLGPSAVVGHVTFVRAFSCADASAILPFDFLRLPFAALFGFVIFGEVADGWIWAGAAIIFSSTFYISKREAYLRKSPKISKADGPRLT
tara:strand:+ start:393 stop:1193 length:801 start_codon:yes stop_codon:yes gene_type:complete